MFRFEDMALKNIQDPILKISFILTSSSVCLWVRDCVRYERVFRLKKTAGLLQICWLNSTR